MSLLELLGLFGYSLLGALVPVLPVELAVAGAAAKYDDGFSGLVIVCMTAATGTMVGKLQVYAIARGGRAMGGRLVRRRMERKAAEALVKAAEIADEVGAEAEAEETDIAEHPERYDHTLRRRAWARTRKIVAGPSIERLGVPAVLVSGVVGIPPFAIVAAVAGAGRMKWWLFAGAGLVGRFVRFAIVYEGLGILGVGH